MIRLDSCADKHGFLTRMAKSIPINSAAMKPIGTGARQAFAELEHWLYSHPSAAQRLHLIEAEQQRRGREVLRLMQDLPSAALLLGFDEVEPLGGGGDRKSTRLNSSHTVISHADFCL